MRRLSLFESERLTMPESIELTAESLRAYGGKYRHWAIAYSGGKESQVFLVGTPKTCYTEGNETGPRVLVPRTTPATANLFRRSVAMPQCTTVHVLLQGVPAKECRGCGEVKPLTEYYAERKRPDGLNRTCKRCVADDARRYREANRERVNARERAWYERRRDAERARQRRKHRENPERERQRHQRYYRENREARQAYDRRYIRQNLDKNRAKNHRRRARERGTDGDHTAEQFAALCARYGHRCLCCGATGVPLTVDHVLPISRGGSNDIANIQPLCETCNKSKGTRHIDYRTEDRGDALLDQVLGEGVVQPRLLG